MKQISNHLLMIRPLHFGANPLTASSNAFQQEAEKGQEEEVRQKAITEWENFVEILRSKGVQITTFDDRPDVLTPDSVFPNNWITFHQSGEVVTYPMFAANRRLERRMDVVEHFSKENAIRLWDWAGEMEEQNMMLEGTGSLILDRVNKVAYACISPRTDAAAFDLWAQKMGYKGMLFEAIDENGQQIYHTNVMMALGDNFAVICLEAIADPISRDAVTKQLKSTGKEVIAITFQQMNSFAGNMLQVEGTNGQSYLVMSQRAYDSLAEAQIQNLKKYAELLVIPLDVIETYGGGSVRCMMAEVFLPEKGA
jgi:hypothetical protein